MALPTLARAQHSLPGRGAVVGGGGLSMASSADTIFAVSTGAPPSGIAVVRVSGPAAGRCLQALGVKQPLQPRHAQFSRLRHPGTHELLDEGLSLWFPGPHSATGEDVAELHVHGSQAVVSAICGALGQLAGCRPAEPGEFTQRAFMADKLDLVQVEGLADLLHAGTAAQRQQALAALSGEATSQLTTWRTELLRALAHVEAVVDFGDEEEDVHDAVASGALAAVTAVRADMAAACSAAGRAGIIRSGARAALLGPPNAGKSSLLNALAGAEHAIVSDIPGTTRDVVRVDLDLDGIPVTMSDTAGVRETPADAVEAAGIARARAAASTAHVRVLVLDAANTGLSEAAALAQQFCGSDTGLGPVVVALNKADIASEQHMSALHDAAQAWPAVHAVLPVSAHAPTSAQFTAFLSGVHSALRAALGGDAVSSVSQAAQHGVGHAAVVTRARHVQLLQRCVQHCDTCLQNMDHGAPIDMVAEDLRAAVGCLGKITGAVGAEDVLDALFSEFCIGK